MTIDRELRGNAARRAALDAHELFWLREAERVQIWKPLGMVSLLDYMDRVLGHNPETARKRIRVARALGELPVLTAALASGALTFCAVRELTRVATPSTERAWCDAAVGRSSREIEELVAGHRPGDLPDDPPDPEVRTHVVQFEVSAATYALLREARLRLDEEHGQRLDDDELVATLCQAALQDAPAPAPNRPGARSSRSRSPCARGAIRAGRPARARGSRSTPRRSRARGATRSTSDRSPEARPSGRTRTCRRASSGSCSPAITAAARPRAAARPAASSSITSSIAPMAARTIRRT